MRPRHRRTISRAYGSLLEAGNIPVKVGRRSRSHRHYIVIDAEDDGFDRFLILAQLRLLEEEKHRTPAHQRSEQTQGSGLNVRWAERREAAQSVGRSRQGRAGQGFCSPFFCGS